ncbi:hypothetical protein LguiA_016785 [Lonicera macranthoides]
MLNELGLNCLIMKVARCLVTKWVKPLAGRFKLNSDGCSRGNPGLSGGGSLLRSCLGEVMWAQADFYGHQSIMVAETRALLQGLDRCYADNVRGLEGKVDSLILMQILEKKIAIPWGVIYEVRRLLFLLSCMDVQLGHTYRENNAAADHLANMGCSAKKMLVFRGFTELPRVLKGIVKLDRTGIQNLRFKTM